MSANSRKRLILAAACAAALPSFASAQTAYTGAFDQTFAFTSDTQGFVPRIVGTNTATKAEWSADFGGSMYFVSPGGPSNEGFATFDLSTLGAAFSNLGTGPGRSSFVIQADVRVPTYTGSGNIENAHPGYLQGQGVGITRIPTADQLTTTGRDQTKGPIVGGNSGSNAYGARAKDRAWDNVNITRNFAFERGDVGGTPPIVDTWMQVQIDYGYTVPGKWNAFWRTPGVNNSIQIINALPTGAWQCVNQVTPRDVNPGSDLLGQIVLGGLGEALGVGAFGFSYWDNVKVATSAISKTYYWDTNGATAGAGGASPAGAWDGTTTNFNTDSAGGAGQLLGGTLSRDDVNFSAGTDGTGSYSVSVSGTQATNSITVDRGSVTFNGGAIATNTYAVASGASATVNSATSATSLTKSGPGALTLNGNQAYTGTTTVTGGILNVTGGTAASGTYDVSAGSTVNLGSQVSATSLTKLGAGTLDVTFNNSYLGDTTINAGTLIVNRLHTGSSVNLNAGLLQVRESSPGISSGHPAGSNLFVSRPTSLAIAPGATLDLTNNDLIIDYSGVSPAADIEALVRSGFSGGDFLGAGITSSTASSIDAAGNYVLAVADNSDLIVPFGDGTNIGPNGGPLFAGQVVDLTTVLVKFTHRADLDLDGLITTNDSVVFNSNYSEGGFAKWATGDLDFDQLYTTNDSVIFNSYYLEELMSLPEPGCLGVFGLMGLGLARRRRRQA